MMIALAVWLIVFTAAAGYGRLLTARNSDGERAEFEFTRIYVGLLVVSAILLGAALFTSLTPLVGAIAALPGIMMYLRGPGSNKRLRYYCAILTCLALFISMREISFYDTALYHQQAVKWLAEHGLVRGVALVNFRFGQISSWFALAAPLDHGLTAGRVGIIGGVPFVLAVVSGFEIVRSFLNRRPELATWAILGLMLSVVAVVWHVDTSLSPDMIVWLLPLAIVTILTDPNATEADRLGRALVVSAMACLVKLTAAPALAYCFVLLAWRFARVPEDRRRLAAFATVALGALTLLIAASIITSGCPLFPSPFGCTSLPWSVGADAARSIQAEIQQFARASYSGLLFPITAAAALASTLLGFAVRTRYSRHVLGISWTGIAFLLIVAAPRYAVGYLLLPVAALIAAVLERLAGRTNEFNGWAKAPGFLTATAAIGALIFAATARDRAALLYPRRIASANGDLIHVLNRTFDYRDALAISAEQRGELTIWVPASSDQCWDAPLPCAPSPTRGDLRLRSKGNLNAGFLRALP